MSETFSAIVMRAVYRAFEGELAGMAPHERREQHRRQIRMLHLPLSNLLLVMAALQMVSAIAQAVSQWELPRLLSWQAGAAVGLLALAAAYRKLTSLRRRVLLGFLFLTLLLFSLVDPDNHWRQMSALSLAGLLLVPIAGLPLLVRPRIALASLALCTLVTFYMLSSLATASIEDKLTFAFYYLMSATAGLVLRRARSNLATRLDQQVESLWQRSVSDPLTGLLNRQGWLNLASTAMQDALDAGHEPAVLFIDVDFFKRVNDAHGHLAGDELLRELGGIIDARIGTSEYSARLGGEEFACLLPDSSAVHAERFARRLSTDYRERAARFGSTLSIGVATYQQGDLLNDLLARADAALYEAKHRGRDQIIVAANH